MLFKYVLVLGLFSLGLLLTTSIQNSNAQTNVSANYTLNMNLKQGKFSFGNTQVFDVTNVNTNVTDLAGASVAKSFGAPISVTESNVFINLDLKVPEQPGSKKSIIQKSLFSLSVSSIEDKEKGTRTYELQPQQFTNAVIGGHNVIDGTLDIQGSKGALHLNLEPTK
jgi:hypothetical protein